MESYFTRKNLLILVVVILLFFSRNIWEFIAGQPESFSLAVPFSTQAPDGDWDNNENCEETSVTMADAFLTGNTADELDPVWARNNISSLVGWEQAHLGYNADTGVDATKAMIKGSLGLNVHVVEDFTENDLRRELLRGHVVILPVSVTMLGNPAYKLLHRSYHVIVIRGYTPAGFLVNDPGVSDGKNNLYSFETLKNAASDWDNTNQKLDQTRKAVLSVSK